jgi:hypothetical protein
MLATRYLVSKQPVHQRAAGMALGWMSNNSCWLVNNK